VGGGGYGPNDAKGLRLSNGSARAVSRAVGSVRAEAFYRLVHGAWCVHHVAACSKLRAEAGSGYLVVPDACDGRRRRHYQLTFVVPVCVRVRVRACVRACVRARFFGRARVCVHGCVRAIVCVRAFAPL
jgi:hypothetical protein